jgi:hypothetical protein
MQCTLEHLRIYLRFTVLRTVNWRKTGHIAQVPGSVASASARKSLYERIAFS